MARPVPDFEWPDGIYVKRNGTKYIDIRTSDGALIHREFLVEPDPGTPLPPKRSSQTIR